jgi:hypothetical protein
MASDQAHAKAAVKSIASALGIEDLEFNSDSIRIGPVSISWDEGFWSVTAPFRLIPPEMLPFPKAMLPQSIIEAGTASVISSKWGDAVSTAFNMLLGETVETIIEAEKLAQDVGIPNPEENLN